MGKTLVEERLSEIVDRIVSEFQPEKIILFGSYAWGTPTPDSDADLFIVKHSTKQRIERERELMHILFGYNFPPMDLLVYTPLEVEQRITREDLFVREILTKGKVLYAK